MAQILSNLPIGAKIKFGKYSVNGETAQPIIWLVVAKNHSSTPAYPSNSVTLITEKLIDLRPVDAAEPTNPIADRKTLGNNRYSVSNIDQWLNSAKAGGEWYQAAHTYDQSPNSSSYVANSNTHYAHRPGFLNAFSNSERNVILQTTIRAITQIDGASAYDEVTRNVFLPSCTEVGVANNLGYDEGSTWAYFNSSNTSDKLAYLTQAAYDNSLSSSKPSANSSCGWWTRTKSSATYYSIHMIDTWGETQGVGVTYGGAGIRPALNLSSTLSISDITDIDGCYTVIFNTAPPVPTTLNIPTIYGGKSLVISWTKVTDPDGDTVTYQLERATDGGGYSTIYTGTNLAYTTVVPSGTTSVQFRLKAVDSFGESSGYITSTSRTVTNNNAPAISGADGNLGTKNNGFTQTYSVTDANNNAVTVTEAIDGIVVRSYVATLGSTNTFSVTGNTWLALANGTHTMTITATDGMDSTLRTYTFTKSVSSFSVENTTPWVVATMPTRIKVSVNKTIPLEATLKVEVCNNGLDVSPTWEDATSSVNGGLVHLFSNTTKTATNWGVKIRVTVNRNGGSGACYISSIGGNFE